MGLISKEDLLNKINAYMVTTPDVTMVKKIINELPMIDMSRLKGEWQLLKNGRYMCSECGELEDNSAWGFKERHNFCWNCGADMKGISKEEKKEVKNNDRTEKK